MTSTSPEADLLTALADRVARHEHVLCDILDRLAAVEHTGRVGPVERLRQRLEADRAELVTGMAELADDDGLLADGVRTLARLQGALAAVEAVEAGGAIESVTKQIEEMNDGTDAS